MTYQLQTLNERAIGDPRAFVLESEERYHQVLQDAAERIAAHQAVSPIVFLAGPSGSGKTTTSLKLKEILSRRGITLHTVEMDKYFRTVTDDHPKTETGEYNFESPLCLDLELLESHFEALNAGKAIEIPKYSFKSRTQNRNTGRILHPGPEDLVIFEGLHALNDIFSRLCPDAFRIYVNASTEIHRNDAVCFQGNWVRLCRRMIRDRQFRNSPVTETMAMWANVCHGEELYIDPFREKADLQFNSMLPYEIGMMKTYVQPLLAEAEAQGAIDPKYRDLLPALDSFVPVAPELVPADSLLREFIGDSSYQY